jgi:hypothetical protein
MRQICQASRNASRFECSQRGALELALAEVAAQVDENVLLFAGYSL